MKREEVIEILGDEELKNFIIKFHGGSSVLDLALAAMSGPTREMVERMRGRWVNLEGEEVEVDKYGCPVGFANCSVCGEYLTASEEYSCQGRFCPNCGAPMTDEAVDMMMKRMEEMTNEH